MKITCIIAALLLPLSFEAARQTRTAQLQRAVDEAMGRAQGAVIVLDAGTGRLLAANHMEVASRKLVRPGSTVKPFTLLALLDAGIVGVQTRLLCRKQVRLAGHNLDCSHPDIPEPLDAMSAL